MTERIIIRLSGLPGSGKSTLGVGLARALGMDLLKIDVFRNVHRNEVWALTEMFRVMANLKDNFIVDSTGFNKNILWIFKFLKARVVDVKLVCDKEILKERLRKKEKSLPKDEYFPYTDMTRERYIDDFFEDMAYKDCDIVVDTSHIPEDVVLRTVIDNLNFYNEEPNSVR